MTFKINQKMLRLMILVSLFFSKNILVLALLKDTEQPIHIDSAQQFLNIQSNSVIFTGNVLVRQGTIEIHADKIIVIRPYGKKNREIIEGYGNPVIFYQMQDNGKPINCYGNTLRYELEKDFITIKGHALLKQTDSSIKGDTITYMFKQQYMEAFSDKGKHVTTVLFPDKWKDKKTNIDTPMQR
ncbi:Lipopolysaccharide export system protein LptA [Candidatus Profftia lariciata]|uniref:lipopolysaccharide ABC transporter substrate-binding protein LptA n=1 Tax=Candidatus Profftia lariciata TaxID=1987921 RepID=UPI001D00CEE7|nr:lipopolysaccharide ABC transporter substrate-binding protein LptA [Candidatus Profftia lariciata]UDG81338.1 Lipopolysaccharide export system protein LptA [Candidatus Profftia lariciata]